MSRRKPSRSNGSASDKETVTDEVTVNEEVRKERIETDGDDDSAPVANRAGQWAAAYAGPGLPFSA